MTTQKTILFLCPHAAAKSVLAMTYFDDLAHKAGLKMIVDTASQTLQTPQTVSCSSPSSSRKRVPGDKAIVFQKSPTLGDSWTSARCVSADRN
jgi:hypothetical protein